MTAPPAGVDYTDLTMTLTFFILFLMLVTLLGLFLWAVADKLERAYLATLMTLDDYRQRRDNR